MKNASHKQDTETKMSHSIDVLEDDELIEGYFGIDKSKIETFLMKYEQRKVDEELIFLASLGGETGLLSSLRSHPQTGISEDQKELIIRMRYFGDNKLSEDEEKHFCMYVWEALGDLWMQVLITAAIVQTVLGSTVSENPKKDWIDGISIILAVLVVVSVGSITNYKKAKKFKKINDANNSMAKYIIIRSGVSREVNGDEILVGDIVTMGLGMIIPADALLLSGTLKIDESSLTGESNLLKKENFQTCLMAKETLLSKAKSRNIGKLKKNAIPSPVLFSGTNVCDGNAKCIVLAVGRNSIKGKIREYIIQSREADNTKTPLEKKLEDIAEMIGYFALSSAIITFVVLIIQFAVRYPAKVDNFLIANQSGAFYQNFVENYREILNLNLNSTIKEIVNTEAKDPNKTISGIILHIFLLCVVIIVVAIPEGLPLAVTLALAFAMRKMMKEKNLVRKINACETIGGANYICTDKTGTLTSNVMSVVTLFDGNQILETEDVTADKSNKIDSSKYFSNQDYYILFKQAVCLNIDATFNAQEEVIFANKSDIAFIDFFHILGEEFYSMRKKYLGEEPKTIAFNSDRKRMTTFVKSSEFPTGYRMFTKGASDILFDFAKYSLDPMTNKLVIFSEIEKRNLEAIVTGFGKKALRTIVICYKDISAEEYINSKEAEESNLIIVSIIGIRDTLRVGVPEAVKKCHIAGITVIMVTGDLKETAVAIARQCHIIPENLKIEGTNVAMTGEEFYTRIGGLQCETCERKVEQCDCPVTKTQAKQRKLDSNKLRKDKIANEEEFKKIVMDCRVIARCRPMEKYALVLGLKQMEHLVAVTGDGTNDALALSISDVGFSMGIQGTDIAKEASDIIIMDDNFASIITAVICGRNIFDNIRKFIQFQLSVNFCACIFVFLTACVGNESPLGPFHMLWLNLIIDSLGSLALATEPPHDSLLIRKPYSRKEKIINSKIWKHIILQSIASILVLLFLYIHANNFVVENNISRINEYKTILNCYGTLPGSLPKTKNDGTEQWYIVNGSQNNWSDTDQIANPATCGEYKEYLNLELAYTKYNTDNGATVHFTIIFNTFVFWTLFNQINARVIDDSINIFYKIHVNFYFISIICIEMVLQIVLIEFGSNYFKVSNGGLTASQWGICLGFASITFLVSFIAKFIPMEGCLESVFRCLLTRNSNSSQELYSQLPTIGDKKLELKPKTFDKKFLNKKYKDELNESSDFLDLIKDENEQLINGFNNYHESSCESKDTRY